MIELFLGAGANSTAVPGFYPEARQRAMNAGLVVDYLGSQETAKLLESGLATIRKVAKDAEMVR